jgi:two-component system chemotaxis response regulator CheY
LLAQGDLKGSARALARLRGGCSTLGLHGAATRLARVEAAPRLEPVAQALDGARALVARQRALLD